jgi:serine/threonine-protein kinase
VYVRRRGPRDVPGRLDGREVSAGHEQPQARERIGFVHTGAHHGGRDDDRRIGTVIAGYRIESRIGSGGMESSTGPSTSACSGRAALKLIAPELAESSGFRERFSREARIAAALTHPNIVTVYDAGEVEGTLYLAMQYIEGSDLARILSARGPLRPYRAVDVCRQIAGALDAAQAQGLIHRDVKPANVLIEGRTRS